jgi:hypothetical protein
MPPPLAGDDRRRLSPVRSMKLCTRPSPASAVCRSFFQAGIPFENRSGFTRFPRASDDIAALSGDFPIID